MVYVALLRGINVGGNSKVDMKQLKAVFEAHGMERVSTYINSGNVIFESTETDALKLSAQLEKAIEKHFGFFVKVLIRSSENIQFVARSLPDDWQNNAQMKCDVMFLWNDANRKNILNDLTIKPDIDVVKYVPGAIIWRIDRDKVTKSGLLKIVGTPLYKQMTIRNCNTVRKLNQLIQTTQPQSSERNAA